MKKYNITGKNGIKFNTANKYVDDDIGVELTSKDYDALVAENIREGVSILGIEGTVHEGITPEGIIDISENGIHDVTEYANVNVNVPIPDGYIVPEGNINLTNNGTVDVTNYATATVDMLVPEGSLDIIENGEYDVAAYASASVNIPKPEGNINITENGEYDVARYATATVDMLVPEGSLDIIENGEYDVTQYSNTIVNVPIPDGYIIPEGTIEITENGIVDVTNYANVNVNVESTGGITPEGTIEITENGEYDVTQYGTANVNIPSETKTVDLLFTGDTQEITSTKLMDKVIINKPSTLIASNIKSGVVIGGVSGTFTGNITLPQLYAPINYSRSGDTIQINSPSSNGSYATILNFYNDDIVVATKTPSNGSYYSSGYHYYSLKTLLTAGTYNLKMSFSAPNFIESQKLSASSKIIMYPISYELTNITSTNTDMVISDGLIHSTILIPDKGYWLPENITIYKNNEITNDYTYNSYSGDVSGIGDCDIKIVATADEEPILRTPVLNFDKYTGILTIEDVPYAEIYSISAGDTVIEELEETLKTVYNTQNIIKADHNFYLDSDGYYTSDTKSYSNTYAMIRVNIIADEAFDLIISYKQNSTYTSSYHYGVIGLLDKALTPQLRNDTTSGTYTLNLCNSTVNMTEYKDLTIQVPKGKHFIDIKYNADVTTGGYFKFKISNMSFGYIAGKLSENNISANGPILTLSQPDYESGNSANATWDIYYEDELIVSEKEGI